MGATLSLNLDGVAIRDRETGTGYVLHHDCHDAFLALMASAGVSLSRFVEIGPVKVETCNLASCAEGGE